jgi:hypothetical protein
MQPIRRTPHQNGSRRTQLVLKVERKIVRARGDDRLVRMGPVSSPPEQKTPSARPRAPLGSPTRLPQRCAPHVRTKDACAKPLLLHKLHFCLSSPLTCSYAALEHRLSPCARLGCCRSPRQSSRARLGCGRCPRDCSRCPHERHCIAFTVNARHGCRRRVALLSSNASDYTCRTSPCARLGCCRCPRQCPRARLGCCRCPHESRRARLSCGHCSRECSAAPMNATQRSVTDI